VENLKGGVVKETATTPKVKDEDVKRLKKYTLKEGDVVFSRVGSVDRSAYVTNDKEGWMFSGRLLRVRAKKGVRPKFLNYELSLESTKNKVRNLAVGGTMPSLNTAIFNFVPVHSLPEDEQDRIVKVLENWDEAIEKLDRVIELKKDLKKGLMQKLLTGELRLPGFKDEWQETLLNEVVTFAKGNVLSKADLDSEGKYECIHYGELFTKYGEVITSVISRTNKDVKVSKSESGDVLMPTSDVTPRGLATASCINKKGVVIGGDALVLRPKKNIDGNFLSFYINSHKKDVMKLVSGTTVFHLYGSGMKKMKIKYPTDVEEQKQIAEVIISVNKQIKTLEKKMSYFQEQKKHLLNNLVTGQIRTPENL
jgi:type I restriction enzyme S subunit